MTPPTLTREEILARAALPGATDDRTEVVAGLLAERYSCRSFRNDPVPRATIDRLLALAQMTGSWCNAQPWQVIVTEGEGTERFRRAMLDHVASGAKGAPDIPFPLAYDGVYGDRRREAGWGLYEAVGIGKGDRAGSGRQMMENFRLFGAPHVLFVTTERALGTYGVLDCGLYLANLTMLMQGAGIASIAQGALAAHAPFIRAYFDIPEQRQLLVGMSFGWPDADHPANGFRTRRAAPEGVVHWINR